MFSLCASHPLRPVTWRWDRARLMREHAGRLPGRQEDDNYVRTVVRFQKALKRCRTDVDRYVVMDKFPKLAVAYDLWGADNTQTKSSLLRHEIEARVLARQKFGSISQRTGLSQQILEVYCKVFFDVSDKLEVPSYIIHQVLGPSLYRGMNDKDYPFLWKVYGYFSRSPQVLDWLVSTFSENVAQPGDAESYIIEDGRATMRRKTALAARMLPLNDFTKEKLLEMQSRVAEAAAAHGETDEAVATSGYQGNLQAFLGQLSWLIGSSAAPKIPLISAELRADEQLSITATHQPVNVPDIDLYRIPEVKTHGCSE